MRVLDINFMWESIPKIIRGVPTSLEIAFVAIIAGMILGLVTALCRIYKVPVLKQISTGYISLMRGTPMLVSVLVFYYGIPTILQWVNYKFGTQININEIPAMFFMFLCYTLCVGAYLSEIIRSAVLAVDKGQMEACYSVGMTTFQGFSKIVLPQAMTSAMPNIGNQFISLLKDTSLCFSVGIAEVLGEAKILAGRTSRFFEAYIVAGLIYWVLCMVFELILHQLERRSRKYER